MSPSEQADEADEILGLIGIAWSTLGINEKFHEVLYSWVCFQQEWETLSSHQRQASSAIEVFRIIEESEISGTKFIQVNVREGYVWALLDGGTSDAFADSVISRWKMT
ncbi:hypothetical protein SAY87_014463 [Trapa incisa]|uniref:Uncharacterized protein n=1 Tax=Trapa incisa TaxID=236973 RepID=A0AAN7JKH5_9MYRT|nr:hypothetical protein SAY87_014463 [Trapa incisa]